MYVYVLFEVYAYQHVKISDYNCMIFKIGYEFNVEFMGNFYSIN